MKRLQGYFHEFKKEYGNAYKGIIAEIASVLVFIFYCFILAAVFFLITSSLSGFHAEGAGDTGTEAGAQAVDSRTLIENSKHYDNTAVIYAGEVIGDIMHRGNGYTWVNVKDGSYAIGVWMPSEFAEKIKLTGKYLVKGDTVKIRGIFHRACPLHGGDLDIHATELELIEKGFKINMKINPIKQKIAFFLFPLAIAVLVIIIIRK